MWIASSSYFSTWTAIIRLFKSGCPPAIIRTVVAVIVDALQGVLRSRWKAHISNKILERRPALTNLYAPASIVWVRFIIGIVATHFHRFKCIMNLCVAKAVFSMSRHPAITYKLFAPIGSGGALEAAARRSQSPLEVGSAYGFFCAAITAAQPIRMFLSRKIIADDQQPRESLSGNIRVHSYYNTSLLGGSQ